MPDTADRHLLFGLIALQVGLIDQAKLVAAFQAWTLDRSRSSAEHPTGRGDLDPDDPPRSTRLREPSTPSSTAASSRRALPPSPSHTRRAPSLVAAEQRGAERHRRASRLLSVLRRSTPTSGRPATPPGKPSVTGSGSASSAPWPGGPWAPCSSPSTPSLEPRGRKPSRSSSGSPTTPPRQRLLRARGRDHRRSGAPRHRPRLPPQRRRRRPAVLCHAAHPRRQPGRKPPIDSAQGCVTPVRPWPAVAGITAAPAAVHRRLQRRQMTTPTRAA